MAKRIRVAVLYNEPITSTTSTTVVSANGKIATVAPNELNGQTKSPSKSRKSEVPSLVDLSELGVIEEMEDIKSALNSLGYKASILNVDRDVFRLIDFLREEKPDLIFNLVECIDNEAIQEMNVAGIYELLEIPYTGANPLTLGIALNKPLVKEILTYHNILTPKFQVFRPSERIVLREGIAFPLIVKPSQEDASVGIDDDSVVYNMTDLKKKIRHIFHGFEQPALVEEYIEGREINIAILGYKKPVTLPISEIDFSGLDKNMHKIVSYAAKWVEGTVEFNGTQGVCPAELPARLEARVKEIALQCYNLIGCRDYGRVDMRITRQGVPYVLEVNPNPDISDDAGFARSARVHGLSFKDAIGKIVESALERAQ